MRLLALASCAVVGTAALAVAGFVLSLPGARPRGAPTTLVSSRERAELLAQLRPPKRARPVVAVLASNAGTETTDFVVPFGVLRASDAAEVFAVAPSAEPVTLMPALRIRPELDVASFDARFPDGADYVVVPAMHHSDDPAVLLWLGNQARSGATVVGICEGALVLAHAGLLDGRSATTHWFALSRLRRASPQMVWQRDRRYVIDRGVVTTTGVSASIPISLTLVEAIAGRARADALAGELGVLSFDSAHSSAAFALDRATLWIGARNALALWSHESLDVALEYGIDEVALALTADAYARTYETSVRSVSAAREVVSRHGLTFIADATDTGAEGSRISLPDPGNSALDAALAGIRRRYGAGTAQFVALQLEYEPGPPAHAGGL